MSHHTFLDDGDDRSPCKSCGVPYRVAIEQPRPCRPIVSAF